MASCRGPRGETRRCSVFGIHFHPCVRSTAAPALTAESTTEVVVVIVLVRVDAPISTPIIFPGQASVAPSLSRPDPALGGGSCQPVCNWEQYTQCRSSVPRRCGEVSHVTVRPRLYPYLYWGGGISPHPPSQTPLRLAALEVVAETPTRQFRAGRSSSTIYMCVCTCIITPTQRLEAPGSWKTMPPPK